MSRASASASPWAALVAGIALAAASVLVVASPAAAHDELVAADPPADSTVATLPAQLTLTFSSEIADDDGASVVVVTDAAGTALADGTPTVNDNVLTQPLAGEASGAVTVQWKVVSGDGHPISGEYSFTVTAAPAPTPTETAEPTPTETIEPEPSPSPTPTPTPTPSVTGVPTDEDSTFADVWPWVVGGLLLAAVAGAVVYLVVSRARREKALAEASPDASGPESGPPADQ